MSLPELTLKTDGEIYYAVHTSEASPKVYPFAEIPCYLLTTVEPLIADLCKNTKDKTNHDYPDIDSLQTTLPRGDCHYGLEQRGHSYVLEERQYDPHLLGSEYINIRVIGYVNASTHLIHATHAAIQNELESIQTADDLIDRICNPDHIKSGDVRRISHNPLRPTLADYGIDQRSTHSTIE